ncbi:MAG: TetR/AcrR family transcriptional regulator [Brevinematales bacterium]|nr:TetR/AcrR family transcriptional regulator [Brevinematales bacterium]
MLEKLENLSELDKKILETAKEEFLENGFFKTNLDNIAFKLKIGKGTIYRHFGKKHTLFLSIVAYMLKQNWLSSKELISKELDFYRSFEILIENLITFNKETSRFFSAVFSEQVWNEILKAKKKDKQIKELMDFIMNCRKDAIEMIARIIDKGKREDSINKNINSQILGEIILITLNQFILSFFMEKRFNKIDYSIEEATKELKEFILRGIGYKNLV